jgi:hypothetical protein
VAFLTTDALLRVGAVARAGSSRSRPSRVAGASGFAALLLAASLGTTACAAGPDRQDLSAGEPPQFESRVGVPLLMDIPILGFFFSRRTVVR